MTTENNEENKGITEEDSRVMEEWSHGFVDDNELTVKQKQLLGVEVGEEELAQANIDEQQPAAEETPEVRAEADSVDTDTSYPSVEDGKEQKKPLKQDLYETKNELNTLKQRDEATKKKLAKNPEFAKKFLEENGVDIKSLFKEISTEDIYDDETIKETINAVNELKRERIINQRASDIVDSKTNKEVELFQEISTLQTIAPSLKTEMPVEDINRIILGLGGSNVQKKQVIAQGISETDFNAYNGILELNRAKQPGRSLTDAYIQRGSPLNVEENAINAEVERRLVAERNKMQTDKIKNFPKHIDGSVGSPETDDQGSASEQMIAEIIEKEERFGFDSLSDHENQLLEDFANKKGY